MNAIHLHLMLNHIPVLGTAFGLGLLLYGLWRKSDELKKTALGVFALVAGIAVPVYLTGESAESDVAALPGVSKPIVEQHDEAAAVAFTGVLVLGIAAAVGLFRFRRGRSLSAGFSLAMVVAALIVSGLMAWTANLGGRIRHSEIRAPQTPPATPGGKHHE